MMNRCFIMPDHLRDYPFPQSENLNFIPRQFFFLLICKSFFDRKIRLNKVNLLISKSHSKVILIYFFNSAS